MSLPSPTAFFGFPRPNSPQEAKGCCAPALSRSWPSSHLSKATNHCSIFNPRPVSSSKLTSARAVSSSLGFREARLKYPNDGGPHSRHQQAPRCLQHGRDRLHSTATNRGRRSPGNFLLNQFEDELSQFSFQSSGKSSVMESLVGKLETAVVLNHKIVQLISLIQ